MSLPGSQLGLTRVSPCTERSSEGGADGCLCRDQAGARLRLWAQKSCTTAGLPSSSQHTPALAKLPKGWQHSKLGSKTSAAPTFPLQKGKKPCSGYKKITQTDKLSPKKKVQQHSKQTNKNHTHKTPQKQKSKSQSPPKTHRTKTKDQPK